jgi:hypothetical protein
MKDGDGWPEWSITSKSTNWQPNGSSGIANELIGSITEEKATPSFRN